MEHFCGGEGGEAERDAGGILEVGAGVGEEDEGHCLVFVLRFFGQECAGCDQMMGFGQGGGVPLGRKKIC